MATEFTFFNSSMELTLSADGITYSFVGRAALVAVNQAGGSATTKGAGASTYTIDWAADIIVALPVKANGTTALINTVRSGDTWTITVHKGNGTFDGDGFDVQEATEVYVFGAPIPGVLTTFNLFDVNGVVCADLSRQPLTYKGLLTMGSGVVSAAAPAASVMAIVGHPTDRYVTSVSQSPYFIIREHHRGWQLNGGTIERNPFTTRWIRQDGGAPPVDTIRPVNAIIIEAFGL